MSSRSRASERYSPNPERRHDSDDLGFGGPKRASTIAVGYDDHDKTYNARYKSSHGSAGRRSSINHNKRDAKTKALVERREESDYDTDYDPRDRLYLSAEDDSDSDSDRRGSSRRRRVSSRRESSRRHDSRHGDRHHDRDHDRHRERTRDRDLDHRSSRRTSQDHGHHHEEHRHSRPRSVDTAARGRQKYPPNSTRSSRPQPQRQRSGSLGSAARDMIKNIPWESVMRTAFKTSTITAMKIAHTPGSFVDKGAKVVSTGVAAALIDTLMNQGNASFKGGVRHAAIRHAAEMALGSMVIGPAVKNMKAGK